MKNAEFDFDIFAFQPSQDDIEVEKDEFELKKFENEQENLYKQFKTEIVSNQQIFVGQLFALDSVPLKNHTIKFPQF